MRIETSKRTMCFACKLVCVALLAALRLYGASFTTSGISVPAPAIALGETFHATLAEGGFDYHPLPDNEYFVRKNSESYAWEIHRGLPEWQGPVVRSGTGRSVAAAGLSEGIYTLEFSGSVTYTIGWVENGSEHTETKPAVPLTATTSGGLFCSFRVVKVASLSCDGVISTTSSPGDNETLIVPVGYNNGSVTVTAAPSPSGVWPTGKPVWSGDVGNATNAGVDAITISTAQAGVRNITATCGNSVTLRIIVVSVFIELMQNRKPLVRVNDNDDDGNGRQDCLDANPDDPDVRQLFELKMQPASVPAGTLTLNYRSLSYNYVTPPIHIWMNTAGSTKTLIEPGRAWSVSDFNNLTSRNLFIDGFFDSTVENDVEITFTYSHNGRSAIAQKNMTVIQLDMKVDMDYDGVLGLADTRHAVLPRRIVLLNDDNDNAIPSGGSSINTDVDKNETQAVNGENDLVPVEIVCTPNIPYDVRLEKTGNAVTAWDAATKGNAAISLPQTYALSGTPNANKPPPPSTVWVEGVSKGNAELKLQLVEDAELRDEIKFQVVRVGVIPDDNRDKTIEDTDRTAWVEHGLYRFWLNSDADNGDVGDADANLPGATEHWYTPIVGRVPNYSDSAVNGRCDLLDFFPVWIDAKELLDALPASFQPSCYLTSSGVNTVLTKLSPGVAGSFLTTGVTNCGLQLNQSAYEASVSSGALALPFAFVQEIKNGNGVILCEGRTAGYSTIAFEVRHANGNVIFRRELPVSLSEVDGMYRRENLRSFTAPQERQSAPPNMPDSILGNAEVFFLHGFSVDETDAYAWDSEMFRRLWQSGMSARFTGVRWRGDEGFPDCFNYHQNVYNAFRTAEALKTLINTRCNATTATVLAHSLGNMVVCSAIKDHAMAVGKYYMLNAAVPSEAFDESLITSVSKNRLRNSVWDGYAEKTWCSMWYSLFPETGDDRRLLTWRRRFTGLSGTVKNYYSSNDQVLKLHCNNNVMAWTGADSVISLSQYGRYSWHKQELFKGRLNSNWVAWAGTTWCGWGDPRCDATTANALPDSMLMTNPVFPLNPSEMNSATITQTMRNELLAKGIPALSPPCGVVSVNNSVNLNDKKGEHNEWGRDGDGAWLHSDLRDMAFFYVYPLFTELLN